MMFLCNLAGFLFIFSGKGIFGFFKFKNKFIESNGSGRNAADRKLWNRKFIRLRQIQLVEKIRIKLINFFLSLPQGFPKISCEEELQNKEVFLRKF